MVGVGGSISSDRSGRAVAAAPATLPAVVAGVAALTCGVGIGRSAFRKAIPDPAINNSNIAMLPRLISVA